MKTYLYLSTAIISVSLATSENAWAQCPSATNGSAAAIVLPSANKRASPTPAPAPDNVG